MILDILDADGAEGSQPDMQRDEAEIDSVFGEFIQLLPSEMQTGSRRGGGASHSVVDGLISFGVVEFFMNVRRQGRFAESIENFFKHAVEIELDNPTAEVRPLDHRA